jgi:hypothetical protein
MFTFNNLIKLFTLSCNVKLNDDDGNPIVINKSLDIPIGLAMARIRNDAGMSSFNCNPERVNGFLINRILLDIGIDNGMDYRLGYLSAYPSIIAALAIFDPLGLSLGYYKDLDPYTIQQSFGIYARMIEDQSKNRIKENLESMVIDSSNDSMIVTYKIRSVYGNNGHISGKYPEIIAKRSIRDINDHVQKISKFSVKARRLKPEKINLEFSEENHNKIMILSSQKFENRIQICLEFIKDPIVKHNDRKIAIVYLEYRNMLTGKFSRIAIGSLIADRSGSLKIKLKAKDQVLSGYNDQSIVMIAELFSTFGFHHRTWEQNHKYKLNRIPNNSRIWDDRSWSKVGYKVLLKDSDRSIVILDKSDPKVTLTEENRDPYIAAYRDPIVTPRGKNFPVLENVRERITDPCIVYKDRNQTIYGLSDIEKWFIVLTDLSGKIIKIEDLRSDRSYALISEIHILSGSVKFLSDRKLRSVYEDLLRELKLELKRLKRID